MNETAISNPAKATNKVKGIKETKNSRNPAVIIGYKKDDKIDNKRCPDMILLKSRTPRLNALAI
jgi:hypothetical protein